MNKFTKVIISFLAIASFSCQPAHADQETRRKICQVEAEISMEIMKARQRGVPINKVLDVFVLPDDPDFNTFCKNITAVAYSKPRFDLKENQHKAIVDFGAEVYTVCIKVRN